MSSFLGIDWADTKHDVCVLDTQGIVLAEFIIGDNQAGYEQLQTYLKTLNAPQLILERPNGLLVDFLLQNRWEVYFIPAHLSASYRPRRTKTDRGDAFLLAHLLRQKNPDCHLIRQHSELQEELSQIVRAHNKLQRELQRLGSQLRFQLKHYYPAVLAIFSSPQQPITYAFLEAFPDPQVASRLSLKDLQTFFAAHRYRYMERVVKHLETLQSETAWPRSTTGHQVHTAALIQVLKLLDQQLRDLHRKFKVLLRRHPDAKWWLAFPGLGSLNAARFLTYLGDNRSRIADADVLRAMAGTVPVTRVSGKQRSVKFRQECSRHLRKVFYDLALKSKSRAPWAKAYFEAQVARGHSRSRANRALANRWVGIVWKLWQTGEFYDETIHQANREKGKVLRLVS